MRNTLLRYRASTYAKATVDRPQGRRTTNQIPNDFHTNWLALFQNNRKYLPTVRLVDNLLIVFTLYSSSKNSHTIICCQNNKTPTTPVMRQMLTPF